MMLLLVMFAGRHVVVVVAVVVRNVRGFFVITFALDPIPVSLARW
jgi:hypothetical protein